MRYRVSTIACLAAATLSAQSALAHDPVFGLGPHVLFKGGVEVSPEIHFSKAGADKETELGLELTYGLSGNWAAGLDIPWIKRQNDENDVDGVGDISAFTKYRFWRKDSPGLQQSISLLGKIKTSSGSSQTSTDSTDGIVGLAYGYEGRKWYRWAALRYRFNGEDSAGLRRGDKVLFDLVGGVRPKQTGYRQPDTVWLLELNGEFSDNAERDGVALQNTGGTEWFVSPGIFWTKRNFAIKAGVQIPVLNQLNGHQPDTDYRARFILEWHL